MRPQLRIEVSMEKNNKGTVVVNARVIFGVIGLGLLALLTAVIVKSVNAPDSSELEKFDLQLIQGDSVERNVKDWEPLPAPAGIREGDYVKTGKDRDTVIACPDGSSLRLDRQTFVKINTAAVGEKKNLIINVTLHRGALFADAKKTCSVNVDLGAAQAVISGARAGVVSRGSASAAHDMRFLIASAEGSVRVNHRSNPNSTIIVTPDQQLEATQQALNHLPDKIKDRWFAWNAKWQDVRAIPEFSAERQLPADDASGSSPTSKDETDSEDTDEAAADGKTESDEREPRADLPDSAVLAADEEADPEPAAEEERLQAARPSSPLVSEEKKGAVSAEQQALKEAAQRQKEYNRRRQAQQKRQEEEKAKELAEQSGTAGQGSGQKAKIAGKAAGTKADGKPSAADAAAKHKHLAEDKVKQHKSPEEAEQSAAREHREEHPEIASDGSEAAEPKAEMADSLLPSEQTAGHEAQAAPKAVHVMQFGPGRSERRRRKPSSQGLVSTPNPLDAKIGGMSDMEATIGDSRSLDAVIGEGYPQ